MDLDHAGSDLAERAQQIKRDRERAAKVEAAAVASARVLAQMMAAARTPVRNIGQLLNVSFQWARQLVNG